MVLLQLWESFSPHKVIYFKMSGFSYRNVWYPTRIPTFGGDGKTHKEGTENHTMGVTEKCTMGGMEKHTFFVKDTHTHRQRFI